MTDRSYIAPAKINLGLEIVRKRADGYHDINTVFYRLLEPRDSVRVREAPIFRLTCSDASLPSDARNLMVKAAHAYTERAGCPLPKIEVHLEKQIPTGAGLGGGSSDAATMLEIMQDYAGGIDNDTLYKLGAQIGADVPFFMIGGLAAAAQGIGDELTPIELELEHSILIVKDPQIFVSTKEAYEGLEIGQAEIHDFTALFETEVSLEEMKAELRNDFEPTVFRRYPKLQQIKQDLYDRGAGFALMSGSGSSIYGLFEDASEAIEASLQFESEGLQTFLSNPRG